MQQAPSIATTSTSRPVQGADPAITRPVCPCCHSSLYRIHRRPIDRLLSLIVPVRRYRCGSKIKEPACNWVGNLTMASAREVKISRFRSGGKRSVQHLFGLPLTMRSGKDPHIGTMDDATPDEEAVRTAFGDMSFGDMAQITLNAIGDAVLVSDPDGKVIYLNKVAEELTGWPRAEALGRPVEEVFSIVDGTTRALRISPSKRAINKGQIVELELGSVLIRHDGTDLAIEDSAAPILNRRGNVAGAVIVFHDARQSQSVTKKISHQAHHDSLTGLPNRLLLMERLTQAIGMAKRQQKQIALLFLDLDYFKQINDSYGHAVGDDLLQEVAADMLSCVRATDTVSRIGGDEFVILLTQVEAMQDAAHVAEKLLAKFALPRIIDGRELQIGLSIGISSYPENGQDAETLMHNADTAMYMTKGNGRNNYQVYHQERERGVASRACL